MEINGLGAIIIGGASGFARATAERIAAGGGKAGRTLGRNGPFDLDDFRAVIDLNLIGTFNTNRLCAAHMANGEPNEDGERGVLINTASIAAFEGQIGQVAYTAAKAGIAGMTLTMARDLGSLGIRVTTIAPSLFATGLTARVTEERATDLTRDAAFPRRLGRPDEYARLAIAIIENPMLNGDTIRLDAGTRFAPKWRHRCLRTYSGGPPHRNPHANGVVGESVSTRVARPVTRRPR